jgi:outer membrane protein TolC
MHIQLVILVTGWLAALPARAEAPPWPGGSDPLLEALVADALRNRPEVRQAEATIRAERERVPQASALPDPMLSLGIQNDSFSEIMIGKAETSYWLIGVSQGLFWPGKRGLRADVASEGVRQAEAAAARVRLTTEADVRRAYLELVLVRDQLTLLGNLESLWQDTEKLANGRYAVGQGPQSDVFRAKLQRTRLRQQRIALVAGERTRLQALNRLRGRPLEEPVRTSRRLEDLADPQLPDAAEALADAERRSPDLAQTRAAVDQAARSHELARKERYPDFNVNAAVMPRGQLDPMWQLGLGITLPIWSGSKQSRAVSETGQRREAANESEESVRQILRLRTEERLALVQSTLESMALYREGLLVQSESTVSSTLAQYQVGRVPFAAVLEALGGWMADRGGYLEAIAQAQRVAIAQAELSLEAPPGAEGGMAGPSSSAGMSGGASGSASMGGGGGKAGGGMSLGGMSLGAGSSGAAPPNAPSKGGGM